MLSKLAKMPISLTIIIVWVIVWLLVISNKNILPILGGKGIAQLGNQYYRFFTAGVVHKNVVHLIFNACAMFWIGYLYENHIGSIRFLLIAILCAIACQAIFMCIYSNALESIGGSGYIFALIGFGLTMQFLSPGFPKITFGTWSGNWLIISAVLGNIPVLSFMNITTVIVHLIAFALGACAALVCWLLGMR